MVLVWQIWETNRVRVAYIWRSMCLNDFNHHLTPSLIFPPSRHVNLQYRHFSNHFFHAVACRVVIISQETSPPTPSPFSYPSCWPSRIDFSQPPLPPPPWGKQHSRGTNTWQISPAYFVMANGVEPACKTCRGVNKLFVFLNLWKLSKACWPGFCLPFQEHAHRCCCPSNITKEVYATKFVIKYTPHLIHFCFLRF